MKQSISMMKSYCILSQLQQLNDYKMFLFFRAYTHLRKNVEMINLQLFHIFPYSHRKNLIFTMNNTENKIDISHSQCYSNIERKKGMLRLSQITPS